jgi:hypothetical protein
MIDYQASETLLLSKKTYRQVVKKLEHYRKQHEEDRKENPSSIPPGWRSPISRMIEHTVRENHERCDKDLASRVMSYLTEKGLLVPYAGDITFPSEEVLPTEEEIRARVLK